MINRKDNKFLGYVLPTDYTNSIDKSGDVSSTVQYGSHQIVCVSDENKFSTGVNSLTYQLHSSKF